VESICFLHINISKRLNSISSPILSHTADSVLPKAGGKRLRHSEKSRYEPEMTVYQKTAANFRRQHSGIGGQGAFPVSQYTRGDFVPMTTAGDTKKYRTDCNRSDKKKYWRQPKQWIWLARKGGVLWPASLQQLQSLNRRIYL